MKRVSIFLTIICSVFLASPAYAHNTAATYAQQDFWFRDDDGGEACDSVPGCTTGATGYGSPDTAKNTTISDVSLSSNVRLRYNLLKDNNGDLELTQTPILDFKSGGTCSDASGWTQVPTETSCGSSAICQASSSNFTDGATTSALIATTGTTDVGGDMVETDGSANSATYSTNNITDHAEWEWMLQVTSNAADSTTYTLRLSKGSSGTNFTTYTSCAQLTTATPAVTTFTLNDYRWYVDSDSENVTDPWSTVLDIAENTALTSLPYDNDPPDSSQEVRLRTNFTVNTLDLSASSQQFKLQYKAGTDGDCTTGSWTDVGATNDWEFATSGVTDGTTLTATKLTASDVLETYAKSNPTATNPNGATTGQDIEYDFHIIGANSSAATQYSFRAVESDGTVFDAYSTCPTLSTEPGLSSFLRHGNFFENAGEKGFFWAN